MRHRRRAAFGELGAFGRAAVALGGWCAEPLRRVGVDPRCFRELLALELVLAERRGRRARTDGEGGPFRGGVVLGLLVNVLFGGIGGAALGAIGDPVWGMGIAQLVTMSILTMMLVGDYLPALVDTADIGVIAALPVTDRTVVAARVGHVVTYLSVALLGLSGVPLAVGTITYGPSFVPVWLVASVLATATSIGLSFGLFLVAMRLCDVERFRDLLLYVQIGVMVALFSGLQIAPRLVDTAAFDALLGERHWWLALLPPFHGAGLLALVEGQRSTLVVVLAALAVVVPVASIAAVLALVGDGFVARLGAMATAGRGVEEPRPRRRRIRDLLLGSGTTRAGYDFVAALSRRERTFRMRTYPLVAISAVLGVAMSMRKGELADPRMLCAAIYLLGMYAPTVVSMARFSDDHEARWLFQVLPLPEPGEFLVGGLTALLLTFTLPAMALLAALVLAVGGLGVAADVAFAAEAVLTVSILSMLVLGRTIPFTERVQKNPGEGNMGLFLLMSLVVGAAIGVHALLRMVPVLFYVALAVQPLLALVALRALRRVEPNARWLRGAL